VPMKRLISRLGLSEYLNVGPLTEHIFTPKHVTLPLKQHAGAPAVAVVKTGQQVNPGDLLAVPEEGKLGRAHPRQHPRRGAAHPRLGGDRCIALALRTRLA